MAVITKKEKYQVLVRVWELEPQGRKNFPCHIRFSNGDRLARREIDFYRYWKFTGTL